MSAPTPAAAKATAGAAGDADVVIVGSGAIGAMAAYQLARKGVRVLLLEAGASVDRAAAVERFQGSLDKGPNSPYECPTWAPHPELAHLDRYLIDDGKGVDRFIGIYTRCVGGTTWHFTGFATRLRPNDLRMRTLYGVGVDWPIAYEDLVPFYEEAEKEWGVAGTLGQDMGAPRTTPYPLPGIPMSYLDKAVATAIAPLGMTVGPFPQARNSVLHDGRPPCCGSASCVPICPIGAKYDGSVHVAKAVKAGARLVTRAVAHRIDVGADGRVSAIHVKHPDGSETVARGKVFVIAAHAIETPKLLLISTGEHAPRGVANSSDQVGRNLMSQASYDTRGLSRDPIYPYRGPITTSGVLELRDGPFRADHAAIGTSMLNRGWAIGTGPVDLARSLASQGLRGERLRQEIDRQLARQLYVDTAAEMLPDPANRVVPDLERRDALGIPRPRVRCRIDDYTRRGLAIARTRHAAIMKAMHCTDVTDEPLSQSVAIIAGTTRMGADPKTSVVDAELRSHDHENLFLLGTGVFPTTPINPPTLTAAALAIRAARTIESDLKA
jgi:choline dehydrogenase-like flavoprotein